MPADGWTIKTIDELKAKTGTAIAIGPFGSRMKSDCYVASGVPVIRGNNISDTRELIGEMVYIAADKAQEVRSSIIFPGDLFFPHRGSIGLVGIVPQNGAERYVQSSSLMKLTCDRALVEPLYLFYFFRSEQGRHELLKNASTVGTPGIGQPLASLKSIRVPLPPLPEQRAIASCLGALDDKIELNRRMNETLEALAQSLFKSWFVDATQSALPKGWRESTIGEETRVGGGSTPSTTKPEFWEGGTHYWATPKDLSNLNSPVLLETERKITDAGVQQISSGLLPVGTVLLSSRAPIGYLVISEIPMAVNQGFIALVCEKTLPNYFVRLWLKNNMEAIEGRANGTTFMEISKTNFRPLPVVVAPPTVLAEFTKQVEPLHRRVVSNLKESRTLAALRDALLPKLLSGELRVTAARLRETGA
jgi:type I restriction enzyme S subunit